MPHVRKQIRDAVATALTGLPTTGINVFKSRVHNIPKDKHPALTIYTNDEEVEQDGVQGSAMGDLNVRFLDCSIDVHVLDIDADDIRDQIALEVEQAMYANVGFGSLSHGHSLLSSTVTLEDAEKPSAVLTLTYQILYRVHEGSPDQVA